MATATAASAATAAPAASTPLERADTSLSGIDKEEEQPNPEVTADGLDKCDYSGASNKTDPEEILLVKKLDWYLMPTLWCMYFLNYLDRCAIASARLNNLEKDLGLVGTQYNMCISVLFIGYLLMQVPSNMLMSSGKIRPSIYMSVCMMGWAVTSALTAMVKDYKGLLLVRFFLGVAEAPYYPGALYLLSIFYTRKELPTRIAILYSGNVFATAVAGLIAAATFGTIDGAQNLKGWQWLFIIEGVVTFFVACVALLFLPDHPSNTRWLSPEQQALATDRMVRDTVGVAPNQGALAGFMQAIRDPRLYLFCFLQNMHISACSFTNFFPTVVGSLGFGTTLTLVLTCPPFLLSVVVGWTVGFNSGRMNERTWHITACMGVALIGFIISCITLNPAARYVACFLFVAGAYSINGVVLSWVSATLGQTTEKKAVSLSIVNVMANVSYIYTAFLYPKSDGPKYLTAMVANSAFVVATILAGWAMRIWLKRTNAQMKRDGVERVFYAY